MDFGTEELADPSLLGITPASRATRRMERNYWYTGLYWEHNCYWRNSGRRSAGNTAGVVDASNESHGEVAYLLIMTHLC